jgi:hypothetical protein
VIAAALVPIAMAPAHSSVRGAASPAATLPYGPVLGALRGYLRGAPGGPGSCGPLRVIRRCSCPSWAPRSSRAIANMDCAALPGGSRKVWHAPSPSVIRTPERGLLLAVPRGRLSTIV